MRTVWYYEVTRRRDKFIHMVLVPIAILSVLFIVSLLLDKLFPVFNRVYMKWPDMVKNLISLPAWNSKLYVNLWQLFSIIYPIVFLYYVMKNVAASVIEEERLETVVYMRNLSVNRMQLMYGKALVWCLVMGIGLLALLIVNGIFFWL